MDRKPYFPMFVDISCKKVLVAGGGRIASRRVKTLTQFTDNVTVISPEITDEISDLAEAGKVRIEKRCFALQDIEGADMVLAATDDSVLNRSIAEECRSRDITVNVSDDQSLCDFFFPAVALSGQVAVGITSSGTDPERTASVAKDIRELLENNEYTD